MVPILAFLFQVGAPVEFRATMETCSAKGRTFFTPLIGVIASSIGSVTSVRFSCGEVPGKMVITASTAV